MFILLHTQLELLFADKQALPERARAKLESSPTVVGLAFFPKLGGDSSNQLGTKCLCLCAISSSPCLQAMHRLRLSFAPQLSLESISSCLFLLNHFLLIHSSSGGPSSSTHSVLPIPSSASSLHAAAPATTAAFTLKGYGHAVCYRIWDI